MAAIIFGTGSVKLKSFQPSELNIQAAVPPDSVIQLRSVYFHLFWIPFFPVRKKWVVAHSGRHYSLGSEAEKAIEIRKYQKGHPVYLFTGTALVVGFALFIYGWNSFTRQAGRRESNKQAKKNTEMIEKKIDQADTTDFFLFLQNNAVEKSSLMKVLAVNGDTIQFRMKYIKLNVGQVDSVKLSYIAPSFDYGGDTLLINKEDIKKSYQSLDWNSFNFTGVDLQKNGIMYRLWNIYRVTR
jgi:hypothetical protein